MLEITKLIALISKEVGSLKTDKRNQEQKYDYISADKILDRVGDAMAKNGVVIIPSIIDVTQEVGTTQSGKNRYDTTVLFSMLILGGGESFTALWQGKGNDFSSPDKAYYKAVTSGHKYFLMKLFNVGVGNEDGEHETAQEHSNEQYNGNRPQPNYNQQPTPHTLAVRDLIAELKGKYLTATDDSILTLANQTEKGKGYLKVKGKPLGFATELSQATYDAIKQAIITALGGE